VVTSLAGVALEAGAAVGDWAVVSDAGPTWADPETPLRRQPLRRAPVRIGAAARLGPHAAVGPGVTIGAGAVVGPYAVVERDVPPGATVAPSAS
jgi:acetyltransferase-like isoleucine patch superfamily enzyme